jgi:nucleotide-binding universal stress UspA family protein
MYDRILVPTDGSQNAEAAARHARRLADELGSTAHILSVVDTGAYSDQLADFDDIVLERRTALEERAKDAVTAVEEIISGTSEIPYESVIEHGTPYETILNYVSENDIELTVMGSHGRGGLDRLLLGSVTERVVRTSDAPVMVVPPTRIDQETIVCDSILIPTDGSAAADTGVTHGLALAGQFEAAVHVLYVIRSGRGLPSPSDPERTEAEDVVRSVVEKADQQGIEVQTHVQAGSPHDSIRNFIPKHGIDLVTMGTHGRSGFKRYLLGSITEKVLRTSDAPVVTTRLTNQNK